MPMIPVTMPHITNNPSLPIKPKEIIKIPNPGIKFESGIGSKTKDENRKIKKPITFSKNREKTKERRGRNIASALRINGDIFCSNIASVDLLTVRLENLFGNFGES